MAEIVWLMAENGPAGPQANNILPPLEKTVKGRRETDRFSVVFGGFAAG